MTSYPPYSPFPKKVAPPATDPAGGDDLHVVCFDRAWLPVVLACVKTLADPMSWAGDYDAVHLATRKAEDLLVVFMEGCMSIPGFDPCCDDELDLLELIRGILADNRTTLYRILDCCKSSGGVAEKQIEDLQDEWIDDLGTDPADIHVDIPPDVITGDLTDDPDEVAIRNAALCWAIREWCNWAWDEAEFQYLRFFNLLDEWIPGISEVLGAIIGFMEEAFANWSVEMFNDDEAKSEVICCLMRALAGEEATNYLAWSEQAHDCSGPEGTNRYHLARVIWLSLADTRNIPAFMRLMGVGYAKIIAGQKLMDDDCHCNPLCYDFQGPLYQGWHKANGTAFQDDTFDKNACQLFDDIPGSLNSAALGVWGTLTDLGAFVDLGEPTELSSYAFRIWYSGLHVNAPWHLRFYDDDKNLLLDKSGANSGGEGWGWRTDTFTPLAGIRYISFHASHGFRVALDVMRFDAPITSLCD